MRLRGMILVMLKKYLKTMLIQTVTKHITRYVNYTQFACIYNYSLININYNLHIKIIITIAINKYND